jgi:hypothetical protein
MENTLMKYPLIAMLVVLGSITAHAQRYTTPATDTKCAVSFRRHHSPAPPQEATMMKHLLIALALVAFAPIAAHAAETLRSQLTAAHWAMVTEQLAAHCREKWPTGQWPHADKRQADCLKMSMDIFNRSLDEEDAARKGK